MLNTLKNSAITFWPANVEKGVFTPFTVTGWSKTLDVIIVYAATIKCRHFKRLVVFMDENVCERSVLRISKMDKIAAQYINGLFKS